MDKTLRPKFELVPAAIVSAGLVLLAILPLLAADEVEARKARILANLVLQYPQLEQAKASIGDITPTEFAGLDSGNLVLPGRGDQKFLVTRDDKKLWMVSGEPLDVSLSQEAIQARLAEQAAAKAAEAAERIQQLDAAIAGLPTRGSRQAPVTIVEFSDFQCPYCARGADTMEQLLAKYPQDVKLVFKHFPLGFHPWAKPAAIASHCAASQSADAFWALHDKYFESQRELTVENVMAKSKEYLGDAGIDLAKWSSCAENVESAEYKGAAAAVDADMALGTKLGVTGTPAFFVNGQFLNGAQPLTSFEPLIQQAKPGS